MLRNTLGNRDRASEGCGNEFTVPESLGRRPMMGKQKAWLARFFSGRKRARKSLAAAFVSMQAEETRDRNEGRRGPRVQGPAGSHEDPPVGKQQADQRWAPVSPAARPSALTSPPSKRFPVLGYVVAGAVGIPLIVVVAAELFLASPSQPGASPGAERSAADSAAVPPVAPGTTRLKHEDSGEVLGSPSSTEGASLDGRAKKELNVRVSHFERGTISHFPHIWSSFSPNFPRAASQAP
jgi:hypothetical protein